jgi:hypothetical protein
MNTIVDIGNGLSSLTFTVSQDGYTFTDAIVDTTANIQSLTQNQIDSIQQTRFTNWLAEMQKATTVTAPSPITYTLVANNFYLGSDGKVYQLINNEYVLAAGQ